MKKLLITILFTAVLSGAAGVVLSYRLHNWQSNQQYTQGWSDGYNYLKPIKDLQRQVGAEPDGIWGRETGRLYEKALCNQYAEQSMYSNVREFDQAMLARIKK